MKGMTHSKPQKPGNANPSKVVKQCKDKAFPVPLKLVPKQGNGYPGGPQK